MLRIDRLEKICWELSFGVFDGHVADAKLALDYPLRQLVCVNLARHQLLKYVSIAVLHHEIDVFEFSLSKQRVVSIAQELGY